MKEFNYFKLLQFPKVQMMGFKEVKGFIYVSISRISPLIVVYNKKIEKRDYRFRVDFENAEKKIATAQDGIMKVVNSVLGEFRTN